MCSRKFWDWCELMYLWFDDGRMEVYTVAYPILRKYYIKGIVALVLTWIGKDGYMSVREIQKLINDGWKLASHSMRHDDLTQLGELAFTDILQSFRNIWTLFDIFPFAFVFPYNKFTLELKQFAIEIVGEVRNLDIPHFHCDGWYLDKGTIRIRHARHPSRSKLELEYFNKILDGVRRR